MSFNYPLQYRTFDQLFDDATVDLKNLALENMMEPQQLIKVVRRVNYDLGLRIMQTKEQIVEVHRHKVRLPDDFYTLNYALICGEHTTETILPTGTHVEEIPCSSATAQYVVPPPVVNLCGDDVPACTPTACPVPVTPKCCMNQCGKEYQLVQFVKTEKRTYKHFSPLRLKSGSSIDEHCPNLQWESPSEGWIQDGFLHTNLENCKVYLNYQGNLEDDNGNMLAPDHPMLNEYYEYAVKERVLENLFMNGEPVEQRLQYVAAKLRPARNNALSIVNMPNFAEMKGIWMANRTAMYAKYYEMFKSYDERFRYYNTPLNNVGQNRK